ncbi:MAG TPA: class I SAM-dependent methyltransferase [Candidatus Acidoferrum sp.]|nr:class I SAM-dependent methyltransferase [Candidatus Acidoferrum sp.]
MARQFLKAVRYLKCYTELAVGAGPKSLEAVVEYCVDRPVLLGQVRSEILEFGKLLKELAPCRSLEIGTNYGGSLFLLCAVSPAKARIISVDLPSGPFGGGYPRRKAPVFRQFARAGQKLHLIRANSHEAGTKEQVLRLLGGEPLDYMFIDADHTYDGVRADFEMYAPLVRSGGMIAFHDIVTHQAGTQCEVERFWKEIKARYRHREFVEYPRAGRLPVAVTGAPMETSGIGAVFLP